MDWLTFIAKMAEFLAWPVATIVLVRMLKPELVKLAPFLKRLKAGPVEAEFERETSKMVQEVEKLPPARPARARTLDSATVPLSDPAEGDVAFSRSRRNTPDKQRDERLRASGAILESWMELEDAIRRLAADHQIDSSRRAQNVSILLDRLVNGRVLSEETGVAVAGLRSLRNQVAHSKFEPTEESANNFQFSVNALLDRIANEAAYFQEQAGNLFPSDAQ